MNLHLTKKKVEYIHLKWVMRATDDEMKIFMLKLNFSFASPTAANRF